MKHGYVSHRVYIVFNVASYDYSGTTKLIYKCKVLCSGRKQTKINLIYLARPEFAQVQAHKVKLFQSFRSFGILLIPSEGSTFTF